ncbi:MAPEG family protein [Nitratireductor aquimarinus]|uniref:MAPEG family protein n=1 Tax=Nitratireductor aquimarinus TaxID=889300 RepID=A0ABU4ANH5_9HYPH|nr:MULTISPECIES: MAPEG family protein [Alphaproteobacteria]MBY6020512.1 MAPEG family protein [Nitratireductor sp. DP7N14-4]MBN7755726.1 MAPEG family protein [Nitratireductor aquimarinus]MBN7762738.1 MAPEG family protein [Nitratireductor aquibiodomus]MBN7777466.1 MAPEG family protein [Nitratireductor pacificus]MBN7781459.1 MAPEG family protein [Nitratireductor pacificus]
MSQTAIFWPMIAQVALVYAVYLLIGMRRKKAVESGSATVSQFRENRDEPAESLYVRNNLANQFELPVLFYAVCLALFVTGGAGVAAVSLAWVFVLSRCGHAYVHVTSNRIRHRQPLFVLGFFALGAMWLLLALRLAI